MESGLLRPAPVSEVIVLHYNYTGKLRGARYQPGAGLRADAVVSLAVCALIVLENLAVLFVLARHPRFHAPMFLLLGSLTLSDLLAGAAYAANILLSGPLTADFLPRLGHCAYAGWAMAPLLEKSGTAAHATTPPRAPTILWLGFNPRLSRDVESLKFTPKAGKIFS
uniref:G-protein coupled receptors family 1 profile domain-containing protein n=1 Tax=Canis lupus dingo TaxID=286419 RepID=A0A8C0LKA5_CANLU